MRTRCYCIFIFVLCVTVIYPRKISRKPGCSRCDSVCLSVRYCKRNTKASAVHVSRYRVDFNGRQLVIEIKLLSRHNRKFCRIERVSVIVKKPTRINLYRSYRLVFVCRRHLIRNGERLERNPRCRAFVHAVIHIFKLVIIKRNRFSVFIIYIQVDRDFSVSLIDLFRGNDRKCQSIADTCKNAASVYILGPIRCLRILCRIIRYHTSRYFRRRNNRLNPIHHKLIRREVFCRYLNIVACQIDRGR